MFYGRSNDILKKALILLAVFLLLISIIIGGCTTVQHSTTTSANNFPEKPITMIIPFSAGGAVDLIARALEKQAPKYLGQPIVIVSKPGAAGTIAWNQLASSNPDGYTLGMTSNEVILQPLCGPTRYHYATALDPLVQISVSPWIMVVSADQPLQNVHELIEYAKQYPGKLKFGHSGIGSMSHVTGATFMKNADIEIAQVPFRGASEVIAALLGGHVQIAFVNPSVVKEQLKSGMLRALAVSGKKRLTDSFLAQIPTFREQGFHVELDNWSGVAAPKGLPPEVERKLAEGLKAMISDPEFKNNMDALGLDIEYLGPKETQERWIQDNKKLTETIQETGILDQIKEQKN